MIDRHGLKVAPALARFLEDEVLPGTGIDARRFWTGLAGIFARFAPENDRLLGIRDRLQADIDAWHEARTGQPIDGAAYQAFLRDIGYLVDEPTPFAIDPGVIDEEVARLSEGAKASWLRLFQQLGLHSRPKRFDAAPSAIHLSTDHAGCAIHFSLVSDPASVPQALSASSRPLQPHRDGVCEIWFGANVGEADAALRSCGVALGASSTSGATGVSPGFDRQDDPVFVARGWDDSVASVDIDRVRILGNLLGPIAITLVPRPFDPQPCCVARVTLGRSVEEPILCS